MDQPTLNCKFPTVLTPEHGLPASGSNARPSLLRRVSQSDPHLDIPHFVSVQDKGFGFKPTLTGLWENSVQFKIGNSSERLEIMDCVSNLPHDLKPSKTGLDRNKSAFELCASSSGSSDEQGPLRKSSSVANYQLNPEEHHGGLLASVSSAFLRGTSPPGHSALVHSEEQGGLTMSVKPSPFSGVSTSATTLSNDPVVPTSTGDSSSTLNRVKSGMMGVFNRGFFAKPVMCNQEENYRYIMALDR